MQPLVGREEEIRQLEAYLDETAEGKGRIVFISGEAGIGKTRLLQELRSNAESRGFLCLWGNSLYETLTPYMPMYDALKSGGLEHLFTEEAPRVEAIYLMTQTGLLIKDVIRKKTELSPDIFSGMLTSVGNFVKESMSKFIGEEKEGSLNTLGYENYRILIEGGTSTNLVVVMTGRENEFLINDMREIRQKVEKEFESVLQHWDGDEDSVKGVENILLPLIESGKYDGIYYGKDDPKARRNLLFENVSLGLVRQTEITPMLLCIEDLQWADPSTLALMHYVSRTTKENRMLVVGTYRTEEITAKEHHPLVDVMQLMDKEDMRTEMNIGRLPKEILPDFLRSMLTDIDFNNEFMSRVYAETEGNPFFIVQLVKYLIGEGIIVKRDGVWTLSEPLDKVTVPSKVYNVILHRLNRVDDKQRKVLDYASVNGEMFTSAVLAVALSARKEDVLERLRDLERVHKLIRTSNGTFRFDHAKIKEVLYNEIPEELRREYHGIIADSIERMNVGKLGPVIGDLAFHYYHARNSGKALEYLIKAAEKAKKEYSNEEAIRFYSEALEFEQDKKKCAEIFEALGDLCDIVGDYNRSIHFYKEAHDLIEEAGRRSGINAKIGGIQWKMGEYDESIRTCEEILNTIGLEDLQVKGLTLSHIGIVHYQRFNQESALKYFERSLKVREEIGDQRGIAASLNNIANIFASRGEYDKALDCYKKTMRTWKNIDDQYGLSVALGNIGILYGELGEYDKSRKYLEDTLKIRSRIGDLRGIAESLSNIADILVEVGRHNEALEHYRKSAEMAEHLDQKPMMAYNYRDMAELYFMMGDMEKTLELCVRALKLAEEKGNEEVAGKAYMNLGMVHREQAKWDESITEFEKSINLLDERESPRSLGRALHEFGLMWKKRGDGTRAKQHLEKALEIFTRIQWKDKIGEVREALGTL